MTLLGLSRVRLAVLSCLLCSSAARADQGWTQPVHAKGFPLDQLPAPTTAASPATAPLLYGGHLATSVLCNPTGSTGVVSDCQATVDGYVLQRSGGALVWGPVPGITGTAHTVAYFNGSGVLNSLSLAAEFTLTPGTPDVLSLTTNGVTAAKLLQLPGLSVLGVAGASMANMAAVTATGGSQFLGTNAAGTAQSYQTVPVAATTGIVANWSVSGRRTFLIDNVNGNDANPGYSDSAGPWNPATLAKATPAGFCAIFPSNGAGRAYDLVIAATGTPAGVDVCTGVASGYTDSSIRATGTNSTAGATAFGGDVNDATYEGFETATGMNAAGYVSTSSGTFTTLTVTKVGGGAPGFGAEPALPLFARLRGDISNGTSATRNAIYSVIGVPASNQIKISPAVTLTTGDVFYLEIAGLSMSRTLKFAPAMSATGLFSTGAGLWISGIGGGAIDINGGNVFLSGANPTQIVEQGSASVTTFPFTYTGVSGSLGFPSTGPVRVDGSASFKGTSAQLNPDSIGITNTLDLFGLPGGCSFADDNTAGLINVTGTSSGTGEPTYSISSGLCSIGGTTTPARMTPYPGGTVIEINLYSTRLDVRKMQYVQDTVGANSAGMSVTGSSDISIVGAQTGESSDVCFAMEAPGQSRVTFWDDGLPVAEGGGTNATSATYGSTCVLTRGPLGSVGGFTETWDAAAAGTIDSYGNTFTGYTSLPVGTYPFTVLPGTGFELDSNSMTFTVPELGGSGSAHAQVSSTGLFSRDTTTYLSDPGGNGIVVRNGSGTTTDRTITSTGATITVTNGSGVSGNPNVDLPSVGPGAGTYGGNGIASVTLDANGRTTAVATATYVQTSRNINTTAPMTGGGSLTTDLTLAVPVFVASGASHATGLVPDPGSSAGTTRYLREDATWQTVGGGGITAGTGDATFSGSGSVVVTNVNAPDGFTQAGKIVATNIVAPSTPASGKTALYVDSTSKNFASKNDAGTVNHGAQSLTCTNQFFSALADSGAETCSTVSFSQVSGTATLSQVAAPTGTGLAGVTSGAWDAAATTVSTGLTRAAGVLTDNLATGISGGQTAYGDTAASGNLTLTSTSNATKGKIIFGTTSLLYFDENADVLSLGNSSPPSGYLAVFTKNFNGGTDLYVSNSNTGGSALADIALGESATSPASAPLTGIYHLGSGYTTSGGYVAHATLIEQYGGAGANTAPLLLSNYYGAVQILTGTGLVPKFQITNAGNIQTADTGLVSFSSGSSFVSPTAPVIEEHNITPASVATAASLPGLINYEAVTLTMTGTTHNTGTSNGYMVLGQETITDASAATMDRYGTLVIKGAGIVAGSATVTSNYALDVQAGLSNLVGGATIGGTTTIGSLSGILEGTSGVVGTITVDASLSYSGTTLSLPNVGVAGYWINGNGYIQFDAKGREIAGQAGTNYNIIKVNGTSISTSDETVDFEAPFTGSTSGGTTTLAMPLANYANATWTYYVEITTSSIVTINSGPQYISTSSSSGLYGSTALEYPMAGTVPTYLKVDACVIGTNTVVSGGLDIDYSISGPGGIAIIINSSTTGCQSDAATVSGSTSNTVGVKVAADAGLGGGSVVLSGTLRLAITMRASPVSTF